MDRVKLAQFRKKSAEAKAKKHQELLDSSASIKDSILALNEAINSQKPYDDSNLVAQLKDLKESQTFSEDIKRLEDALKQSTGKEKFDEVIQAVGNINNKDVVEAVNNLIVKLEENTPKQSAKNYQPVRRVIKVGDRFLFDDKPTPTSTGGVASGGRSSVQNALIRNGNSIAVVNPDGTPISAGGGGGDVTVDNFPTEYPLPDEQITELTPQTDGLTDDELRASPLEVTSAVTNYATRIEEDSVNSNLTYIGNAPIGSGVADLIWQIKRLDSTTGLIKLWRDGDDNFDNAWSTREAGSYS
jgi:chromatin segregation and condensation protein Rec8/ScpA/Scc1 (kleisin family)